jgi:hypothetical protein
MGPSTIHPEARAELLKMVEYYMDKDLDLADAIADDYERLLDFIETYPHAGPPLFGTYRHVVFARFPYMLAYRIANDTPRILAVMNLYRDPAWMQATLAHRR